MKISKDKANHYQWGDGCDGWHLVKNESLSVIQERMPPHTSEIRHYHGKSNQFFYILSGAASMELEGKIIKLVLGEGLEIKTGQSHQMFNHTDDDLEFIVVSCPPNHGDRFVV